MNKGNKNKYCICNIPTMRIYNCCATLKKHSGQKQTD
jgi:hypothetical protein